MKKQRPKIIAIVGPTASGKSELAVRLAKRFGGEVISADSRQVYKGLNIGTGKVPGQWRTIVNTTNKRSLVSCINRKRVFAYGGIPHHCIDFVPPQKTFTAADFKKCAESAIKEITACGRVPIIAGGTGFYIDAVIHDLILPAVPPDRILRRSLEKKSVSELFTMLKKLDPKRAKSIDPQNPRRLIRAIEIAMALGRVPRLKKQSPYQALWLGIKPPPDALSAKIRKRLYERMRRGMITEARHLHKNGLSWKRFYALGLEYRCLADFLQGKITKAEMLKNLETAIRHYARRQMVWFKRNREIRWVKNGKEAERWSRKFLSEK